jgi:dihydrofolate reductase
MDIVLHAAVAENGVIGRGNGLPWRLSTDLKRFKAQTTGNPIVMGRKTWESFPKRPLPDRHNIIVTRNACYAAAGATVTHDLDAAFELADRPHPSIPYPREICVIGGAQIYEQSFPRADRLHITHVLASIDGDAYFPSIDPAVWEVVSSEDFPAGERDTHPTRHVVYRRRDKTGS